MTTPPGLPVEAVYEAAECLAPPRAGFPAAHADHCHHRGSEGALRPSRGGGIRHRRYRIHARAHLLAGTLRRAACRRARGRGDRCAGAGDRSRPARRPAGQPGGDEGVPRRAAGHRDLRAALRRRAAAAVRHPDRRHGGGVRRPGRLRRAGRGADRRFDRQGAPVQRLVGAAAVGLADHLRRGRRHLSAHRLHQSCARGCKQDGRLDWVAEEMAELADPGTLPRRSRGDVGTPAPAQQQPPLPRHGAGAGGVARARGAAGEHPAPAPAARRDAAGDRRHRARQPGCAGARPRHQPRLRRGPHRRVAARCHRGGEGAARRRAARGAARRATAPGRRRRWCRC